MEPEGVFAPRAEVERRRVRRKRKEGDWPSTSFEFQDGRDRLTAVTPSGGGEQCSDARSVRSVVVSSFFAPLDFCPDGGCNNRSQKFDRPQHAVVRHGADGELGEVALVPEERVQVEDLVDDLLRVADRERAVRRS